jgi:Na+/melibiose symporter-like transporter
MDDNDFPQKRDGMTKIQDFAYSIGHFNNDLCAAMWFIYLTWYVNRVVGLSPLVSVLCMLSGQITDGITTPIVGYYSDKL